jgi:anaphase-promoting complex subunit 1
MRLDRDDSMGENRQKIVRLRHAVGSKVSVVYQNGEEVRVDLDFRVPAGLVRKCFEALSFVLSPTSFSRLKKELIHRYYGDDTRQHGEEDVWSIFADTIRDVLGLDNLSVGEGSEGGQSHAAEMSSDPTARRLASLVRKNRPEPAKVKHRPALPRGDHLLSTTDAAPIALALHLVAQDSRLSESDPNGLVRVGGLVMEFFWVTGRLDWWDYWKRILPTIRPGVAATGMYLLNFRQATSSLRSLSRSPQDMGYDVFG